MGNEWIAQLLWAVLPGLITGVVMAIFGARQKKQERRAEQREVDRLKSESLRISLLLATAKLTYAVAMAVKRGTPNGEVEEGIKEYDKAMGEFREFERTLLARKSAY